MAMSVKDTPILTGKDARKFEDAIKNNEVNKVSSQEYKKTMDSYSRFEVIEPRSVE